MVERVSAESLSERSGMRVDKESDFGRALIPCSRSSGCTTTTVGGNTNLLCFDRFQSGYGPLEHDDDRMLLYRVFPYLDKLRWIEPEGDRAGRYRNIIAELISA